MWVGECEPKANKLRTIFIEKYAQSAYIANSYFVNLSNKQIQAILFD